MTAIGSTQTTMAMWRHERNIEMANVTNAPKFPAICVNANNVPRIDFSLWNEANNSDYD